MKKNFVYIFIVALFSVCFIGNVRGNPPATPAIWGDTDDAANQGGQGGCINGAGCNNYNKNAVQITIQHGNTAGNTIYDQIVFTSSKAEAANNPNWVYADWMTTESFAHGTAQQQTLDYLSANGGANMLALLESRGLTDWVGSKNGSDAYGVSIEGMYRIQDRNGNIKWMTDRDALNSGQLNSTNMNRVFELLTESATGYLDKNMGALMQYFDAKTIQECISSSAVIAASPNSGCGRLVLDITDLLKGLIKKVVPAPSCPNGRMNLNNPSPTCTETTNGISYNYSYTAGSGGQSNIHRLYGIDQNAPGTGAYCRLYCQEYGTATLPGALADTVQLGSYIIWPTSSSNTTNKFPSADNYPLKFSGQKSCKLVLMPDHNNFPGNGCLQDPVAEYMCIYSATSVSGSKYVCGRSYNNSIKHIGLEVGDYAGVHYENVRIGNGNYFNEPSYCGTEKNALETLTWGGAYPGSTTTYEVKATAQYYNSESRFSDYNNKVKQINQKAHAAKNACQGLTNSDKRYAEMSEPDDTCSTCTNYDLNGFCINEKSYKCWSSAAKAARERVANCSRAKSDYSESLKITDPIENSMKTCRTYITDFNYARNILNEIGLCGNFSASGEDYYHFSSKASMSYNNGEYSVGGHLIKENSASIGCNGQCSGLSFKEKPDYTSFATMDTPAILAGKVSQIEKRSITFTADTDVYGSNSNYSYIDKKNNKYSKSKLNSNYLEIKSNSGGLAKVLPTDYNVDILDANKSAKKYTLNLKDTAFGENNRFNVTNSGDYVCKYEMSKKNDGCICPQDSKMPGKDLMKHVAEDPISCADAQQKYCDDGPEEPYDKLYCPDMRTPLTSCLKTGIGYQKCVDLVCPGSYKCKNTNGLRTGMDITDCVQTKLSQGLTVNQALDYCDSVVCPIGKTIIYRTIKLENPFPGKNISKIVSGFNNDVKGRYPGTNWNGLLTVYNKIRNNREHDTNSEAIAKTATSTSGSTIYQTKTPLYTFVLNGITIKNIREYNDKQKDGYNDFKLECKTNNSSGCISSFVHNNNLSGLTSGTCSNISLNNSFYRCAD